MRVYSGLKARFNGIRAEHRARQYLVKRGLTFVGRNYNTKFGEIDLIFKDGQQIVFVEVKSRQDAQQGMAHEYYNQQKQQKLIKTIETYFINQGQNPHMMNFRLDLVAITEQQIDWYRAILN